MGSELLKKEYFDNDTGVIVIKRKDLLARGFKIDVSTDDALYRTLKALEEAYLAARRTIYYTLANRSWDDPRFVNKNDIDGFIGMVREKRENDPYS